MQASGVVRIFASFHVQVWAAPDGAPLRVRVVDVQTGAVRELDREHARGVIESLRAIDSQPEPSLGAEGGHGEERPAQPADATTARPG